MRNVGCQEITAALGYSFSTEAIKFQLTNNLINKEVIERLKQEYYAVLPKINLTSEMSKREFMIAPVLWELIRHIDANMSTEYPLKVNDKLSGTLDYFIRSQQNMVIIEAKKADLENGFNQLAAELIALDLWETAKQSNFLYGAVSVGELWRFAVLNRKNNILARIYILTVSLRILQIFLPLC